MRTTLLGTVSNNNNEKKKKTKKKKHSAPGVCNYDNVSLSHLGNIVTRIEIEQNRGRIYKTT